MPWHSRRPAHRARVIGSRPAPAFSLTVVAVVALAIGASTAIFSIVDATLLRPLPFRAPDFRGLSFDTDVWLPATMMGANGGPTDLTDRGERWLGAVGRLRDGVTREQAQRDLDRVAAQLTREFPATNTDRAADRSADRVAGGVTAHATLGGGDEG